MIRVLIADDEELLRTALTALLNLAEDITVIGHCAHGQQAINDVVHHQPDVILLDIEMPRCDGLSAARAILARDRSARIIVVTRHARPGMLTTALSLGVRGFVPKNTSADDLAEIIRRVYRGERYVDSALAISAIHSDCPLTNRERDVLRLTGDGKTVREIAQELFLAPGTVRNYLSDAITKLGVGHRHAAAKLAREYGWL